MEERFCSSNLLATGIVISLRSMTGEQETRPPFFTRPHRKLCLMDLSVRGQSIILATRDQRGG